MKFNVSKIIIISFLFVIMATHVPAFAGGKTIPQIIGEAKSQIAEVTVEEIKNDIDASKNFILLDVRTLEEFNALIKKVRFIKIIVPNNAEIGALNKPQPLLKVCRQSDIRCVLEIANSRMSDGCHHLSGFIVGRIIGNNNLKVPQTLVLEKFFQGPVQEQGSVAGRKNDRNRG